MMFRSDIFAPMFSPQCFAMAFRRNNVLQWRFAKKFRYGVLLWRFAMAVCHDFSLKWYFATMFLLQRFAMTF